MIFRHPLTPESVTRIIRRRLTYFASVAGLTILGAGLMAHVLFRSDAVTSDGRTWNSLTILSMVLFVPLFYHLVGGVAIFALGLYVEARGRGNPLSLFHNLPKEGDPNQPPMATTAICIPVYNEDVTRVFEGLRVVFRDLEKTGQLQHFDFFILSDSDQTSNWVEEEVAWMELCRQLGAFNKIFYRKRRKALNRKSGNISDFCRRWGSRYRYMVVFDADSVMSGETLVKMVRMMEGNPAVGILQTAPRLIGGESLFSRVFQFVSRLYGPIFCSGLNYWQVGESNYWGHNAIIRIEPFMKFCALPDLPGSEPFGGRILSHDFVKAALMRKAGFYVCLVPELEGSFEEGPPTLLDHLKRDRRWCQGNLQHFWLLWAKGWTAVHRLMLVNGVMSYAASALWFLYLMVGTLNAISGDFEYPAIFHVKAKLVLFLTLGLIFIPKIIVYFRTLFDFKQVQQFGGHWAFTVSFLGETVFFVLLAPVFMIFHARFVVLTILGQGVRWATQNRKSEDEVDWREAILNFWTATAFGVVWGVSTYIVSPALFLWLSPVLLGLLLCIPFHIISGSANLGRKARELGFFLTPEEISPPWVVKQLGTNLEKAYRRPQPPESHRRDHGLMMALLDPYVNALHLSLLRQRKNPPPETREFFEETRAKLLKEGPPAIVGKDKTALLYDYDSVKWLHQQLWSSDSKELALWWQTAIRQYNTVTVEPVTPLYR